MKEVRINKKGLLLIVIGLILIVFSVTSIILLTNNKVEKDKKQQDKINQNEKNDEEIEDSEEQDQEQIEQDGKIETENQEQIKQDEQKETEVSSQKNNCENLEFQTNMFNIIAYMSGSFPTIKNCKYVLLNEKDFKNESGGFYDSVGGDSYLKNFPTTSENKLILALHSTFDMSGKIEYRLLSEQAKAYYSEIYAKAYNEPVSDKFVLTMLPFEKVKEAYKTIFNEDLSEPEEGWQGKIYYTTNFYYDRVNHAFLHYLFYASATGPAMNSLYMNRIEYQDDYAYVYVNVGSSQGDEVIYNDYDSEDVVEPEVDYKTFKIDETNYMKFKEYKFSFKKNNEGNYYFVSVE